MGRTPEGIVKDGVRKLLDNYSGMWYYMPVPTGYGKKTVDFLGCFRGTFFAIETKAEGKKPTALQEKTVKEIIAAGGRTFVIIGENDAQRLFDWLEAINGNVPHVREPSASEDRRPVPA